MSHVPFHSVTAGIVIASLALVASLCVAGCASTSASSQEATETSAAESQDATEQSGPTEGGGAVVSTEYMDLPTCDGIEESDEGVTYVAGEIIVSFDQPLTVEDVEIDLDGLRTTNTAGGTGITALDDSTFVVRLNEGASVSRAIVEVSTAPDVISVQPNYLYETS